MPLVKARFPEQMIDEFRVKVAGIAFVLFNVRLDKAVKEEGILNGPASVPPNESELEDVVNNVPEPEIGAPFKESVNAPIFNVPLFNARVPPIVTEPERLYVAGVELVLLMVKLFRLPVIPGIEMGPAFVPLKINVEEEVPEIVPEVTLQLPIIVNVLEPNDNAPFVKIAVPLTVTFPFKKTPPTLFIVRLFKIDEDEGISYPHTYAVEPL